ncbi:hypothetical protein DFJ73DRAFT_912799 [Zopfochytrium polystomum]|nr:hypothetical protein DFJ73DRAFT_912799 [Zopfochytrium polystomum]
MQGDSTERGSSKPSLETPLFLAIATQSLTTVPREVCTGLTLLHPSDLAAATVDRCFPALQPAPSPSGCHIDTHKFIAVVVRQAQLTYFDLQLALFYCVRWAARSLSGRLPTPQPPTAEATTTAAASPTHPGKTFFLACLVLASKYLHDFPRSIKDWSRIAQVPAKALVDAERAALMGLGFTLHVGSMVEVGGGSSDGGAAAAFSEFCVRSLKVGARLACGFRRAAAGVVGKRVREAGDEASEEWSAMRVKQLPEDHTQQCGKSTINLTNSRQVKKGIRERGREPASISPGHVDTHKFIADVVRQTQSTFFDLQLGLFYLTRWSAKAKELMSD